jgi:argininosuccinate synthase
MNKIAVLAFSGGLDTSYCVPALMEREYDVITVFVDTGGATDDDLERIRRRAVEVGAKAHVVADASDDLWQSFVVPFVMGGATYQDQYPILCSDRYVIASRLAAMAEDVGASAVAHGCTAMGNDQVRIDHSLRCLTKLPILAPIRDLQERTKSPRQHEIEYLQSRGISVDDTVRRYTINENVLGATISGAEIDKFEAPSEKTHRLTRPRSEWPDAPLKVTIAFQEGKPVALDGEKTPGPKMLQRLNELFGAYGVGRGMYTGDTVIGLKGRIVFESPGLTALLTAHRALEECVLSSRQNAFKPNAARAWTQLVYSGLFHEPLRADLEALIASSQRNVTGEVEIETIGGICHAVAIRSDKMLVTSGATYAQSADWTRADAEGFIKLYGMSSAIASDMASACTTATPELVLS